MDRKGWIILIICSLLIVLNVTMAPDRQKEEDKDTGENTPKTTEKTPGELPKPHGDPTAPTHPTGQPPSIPGLTEEHIETVGENTFNLITGKDGKDVVTFTITSKGGGIKSAELHDQHVVDNKEQHIFLNENSPAPIGALSLDGDSFLMSNYDLVEKTDEQAIYAQAKLSNGLSIVKRWALSPKKKRKFGPTAGDPWLIYLDVTFSNNGKESINLADYSLYAGASTPLHQREWENQGGAYYLDNGSFEIEDSNWFKKSMFHSARPVWNSSVERLQYAGVSNQFFTTMIRPEESTSSSFWAKASPVNLEGGDPEKPKAAVRAGFSLPTRTLGVGEKATLRYTIYTGPKEYSGVLRKLYFDNEEAQQAGFMNSAPAAKVMNYGWFSFVSVPLNRILNWFHNVMFSKFADNWAWGLSVIALTILIRICIWPLHNKSTRTMKRMSKLQPIMKDLREKYKDDPNKLNQETMKLYREYHINPMGGCLPMFLQIPIFFGYYKMLQFAVELRGEEFLWVKDLSMPDTLTTIPLPFSLPLLGDVLPINVLPILMAVTMVLQMRMTPKTGDKMQQRIMMFMPLMFFFFCYNFASALALYWTTQNIFSIGQTWLTNRMPEPELEKRKPKKGGKKSFMERMAERAEDMQRAQQAAQSGKKPMRNATPDKPKKKRNPKTGG
ncbi:MAG: membrane protein insertase YidC [Akkermansiaceae bacterium]